MGNPRKLTISARAKDVLTIRRGLVDANRLVYVMLAGTPRKYPDGRSRVVYIGTTKRGVTRVASSVADKAERFLESRGGKELHVRLVTCTARPGVKSWLKLERALLVTFRREYGQIPLYNKQGRRMKAGDVFDYFTESRVRTILRRFE